MKRLYVKFILVIVLLTFLFVCASEAQNAPDLSLWNGTFWKITTSTRGYYFSSEAVSNSRGSDGIIKQTDSQWGVVTADVTGTFIINIYSRGSGGVCSPSETLEISYIAGNELGFVASYDVSQTNNYATGLLYVKGKLDRTGTAIQSGKIEPLGQYVMASDVVVPPGGDRIAYRIDLKGTKTAKLGCTF